MSAEAKSDSCCPAGAPGRAPAPKEYVPKGTELKLGDLPAYVTGERSEYGIVVFQEIWGIKCGRLFQICDAIADAGFVVAIADYHRGLMFNGDWSTFGDFLAALPLDKIDTDLKEHVYPLLASKGAKKFGAVGFCFGAVPALRQSAQGNLAAVASCHPSHGNLAPKFGTTAAAIMQAVRSPVLLFTASDDLPASKPGGDDEKILRAKPFGAACEFREFTDMSHGWVTRGKIEDPDVARDYEAALAGVIAFLKKNVQQPAAAATATAAAAPAAAAST